MTRPLTWLYVPADRPDRVAKALAGEADVIVVDLEDAVAPGAKDAARAGLAELLNGAAGRGVQVRINALGTSWAAADLATAAALPSGIGVRAPKVESADDVARLRDAVADRELHVLLETPLAIEHAFAIASAGVSSIGLGEADLRSALGVANADELSWQRARVVNAAAAAGLEPPAMSVYPHLRDDAGLDASCRAGRAAGFLGRAAIHPRQLPIIRSAFTPAENEVIQARAIVTGVSSARAAGAGTFVLPDGSFLDVAMLRAATRTLELAGETGTTTGLPLA